MHVFAKSGRLSTGLLALLLSGTAGASTQQLEADLRQRMAGENDTLAFSRIYEDEASQRYIAEDVAITHANGDVITIESYSVEGDYDRPDQVVMDGIAVRELDQSAPILSIAELVFPEPSRAVFSAEDMGQAVENVAFKAVNASDITLRLEEGTGGYAFDDKYTDYPEGQIHISGFTLEGLSRDALQLLVIEDVSAELTEPESGITSELALANLRIEELVGLDSAGAESVEHAELNGFNLTGENWQVALDRFWVNGNGYSGDVGFERAYFDVAELIHLMPNPDRLVFQSISNVLTGGTGELRADGHSQTRWDESGKQNRLVSEGDLTLSGAAGLEFTMNLPVTLPAGATIEQATSSPELMESVTLHGGDVVIAYTDEGMMPRLTAELADKQSINEGQVISQSLAQAQQLGQLLGPQMTKLMTAMVDIMAGHSRQLTVNIALPNPFPLDRLIMDPLGSSEQLRFTYELE